MTKRLLDWEIDLVKFLSALDCEASDVVEALRVSWAEVDGDARIEHVLSDARDRIRKIEEDLNAE